MPLVDAGARVGHQLQHGSLELHDGLVVAPNREPRRAGGAAAGVEHAPRAGHAQVRVDRQPALEAQEEVLAVRVDRAHRLAGEPLGPAVAAEARVQRLERVGHVALEHGPDAVRGVVDRVALGHSVSLGAARRSRGLGRTRAAAAATACRPRCGGAGRRGRRASPPAARRARTRGGRSCPCRSRRSSARRRGRRGRSGARRGRGSRGERRWNVVPRPTSSRLRTKRRSPARFFTRGTAARAPRWSAWPVYGRSSAPLAISQTSQAGPTVRRRGASATSVPTPDALSSAPGAGGTESVCAISTTRQSAGVSKMPTTLRERPCPGTRKRSWAIRRPAARNRFSTRACARRSAAEPAGRGPARARERAKR